jgi:hypothetical protein
MKNLNVVLSVLVLSVVSTACGNMSSPNSQLGSSGYNTPIGNTGLSANSQCAASPNVVGQGYNSSLSNQYRACNGGSASAVKIYAEDSQIKNVCVFPATANGTSIAVFANAAQCGTTNNTTGLTVNFGASGANAVYIVDYNVRAAFNYCLAYSAAGNGSLSACAAAQGIGASYGFGLIQ